MACTAPLRRAALGGPLGQLAQVDPVTPHFQRTRIDACHGQQIAHHVVEALRLVFDAAQQLPAGPHLELVGIVEQTRRRPENGGKRRAEVVRDRGQQRIAHALGLGRAPY